MLDQLRRVQAPVAQSAIAQRRQRPRVLADVRRAGLSYCAESATFGGPRQGSAVFASTASVPAADSWTADQRDLPQSRNRGSLGVVPHRRKPA